VIERQQAIAVIAAQRNAGDDEQGSKQRAHVRVPGPFRSGAPF
jgi:hypothetical protein